MPITFETDRSRDLTVFTASGDLTFVELINTLDTFVEAGATHKQIFNFSNSKGKKINFEQLLELAERGKTHITHKAWQTAIVMSRAIGFGKARVYKGLSKIENMPQTVKVFRSMDEAYEWLNIQQEGSEKDLHP